VPLVAPAGPRERRLFALGVLLLAALGLALYARYPTYPAYDSLTAFSWGRDILDGRLPAFDAFRAPTQHPLLLALGVVLQPVGSAAAQVWVVLCVLSLVALIAAMFRLGRVAAGVLGGLVAAALIASRLNFALLTTLGFVDIPYCALTAWAAVLEVERPRRGGPVWVLLALAGLLRPEAWVLAGLYALWIGVGLGWPGRARAVVAATVAPVIWAAVDLAVTGNPLFSLTYTDASAAELQRERPLLSLPWLMVELLAEILKWPVLAAAVIGLVLALLLRRRDLRVPAVLIPITAATYLVIATGGLPSVYRYLLIAGLGLAVFAAYALTGWTTLPADHPWRRSWAASAGLLAVFGALWTLTHTSPRKVTAELRERVAIRADLVALMELPAVLRARACGPVTVPTHKLVPELRLLLDTPEGYVRARANPRVAPATAGVAVVIDRRFERRPALNVYEVPRDADRDVQAPPFGFARVGANRHFAAYARCA
jgi:hypothetical protein